MAKEKSIRKRILLTLLLLGIIPFAYPFGHPLLSLNDINLRSLATKLPIKQESTAPRISMTEDQLGSAVTVYRWRDADGNWSFGSTPPEKSIHYKAITIQSDANLIQGMQQEDVKEKDGTKIVLPDDNGKPTTLMGYSAEDVSKIMQSAKEARAAMEQRYKQEQAIIEGQ